jgi:hypothetical protein
MKEEFGSPSAWQNVKANEWIHKYVYHDDSEKFFLKGQINLQFIRKQQFRNIRINIDNLSEKQTIAVLEDAIDRSGEYNRCNVTN